MSNQPIEFERYELREPLPYRFETSRRGFLQSVATGLLITWTGLPSFTAEGAPRLDGTARIHIGADGIVTAGTGKMEMGQGARTQIIQAVAEELHVPLSQVRIIMGDTNHVPDDGGTWGSNTTPETVPAVREAAAATREALLALAAKNWDAAPSDIALEAGTFHHSDGRTMTLAELASAAQDLNEAVGEGDNGALTPRSEWNVLGASVAKAGGEDVARGAHAYPSDIRRPGMLFGVVLRAPSFGASLEDIDLTPAQEMEAVTVVRDGDFVACAAPSSYAARKAVEAIGETARWKETPQISDAELYTHMKENASSRGSDRDSGGTEAALDAANQVIRATFHVPYIAHACMETHAGAAEWEEHRLTVWSDTQHPFGLRGDLARAFGISQDQVRVLVPDTGGGFGGKQRGEAAYEAARLAREAGKPVSVQWTREEDLTWGYFRPAALIEVAAGLDADKQVVAWDFTDYNAGGSGLECPYTFPEIRTRFRPADSPLRQGSYRALAATANNFAREVIIDELAAQAGEGPLAFRKRYLDDTRLIAVLDAAADRFGWDDGHSGDPARAFGIACGFVKGGRIATCVEVAIEKGAIKPRRICAAFDCGAVQNPKNLQNQIEGCVMMGLGAALREQIKFENGRIKNDTFGGYRVPRFSDLPQLEVVIVDLPDEPSAGAGETPIIAIAPAIANAVRSATGKSIRAMPVSAT